MGDYGSPEDAERKSPYYTDPSLNNPQYQTGNSRTTSISRWNQESGQWEYDAAATRQAQAEEAQRYGYAQQYPNQTTSVQRWDNATGQWVSQAPSYQEQARAAGTDPVAAMRNQALQYGAQQAQKDYFDRADIYTPDDPAQLNLMKQGYTAGQAAEMLRYDAQQRGDYRSERKYETLRLQAWTTATGESAAYHTAAKESGLPQAANPYEYGADLFTYAEKGYPRADKEKFSPVDYRVLNLPEGEGGQAHIWKSDQDRKYDLRGAMDTVAYAQRSGQMGIYGNVESRSSSYGKLSLEEQQAVGRFVAENPAHQREGFIVNEKAMAQFTPEVMAKNQGAFVSSVSPTAATQGATPAGSRYLTEEEMFKGSKVVEDKYVPSRGTLTAMEMYGGIPVVGGAAVKLTEFVFPGTREQKVEGTTQEVDRSRLNPSGGAMWTAKFINPATNKPTDVMKFKEGDPYIATEGEYKGQMVQDYKVSDLSKVTITPTKTISTQEQSGFELGESRFAEKYTKGGIENYQNINTGSAADYPENFLRGVVRGVKEKPLTAAINAGVSTIVTVGTLGYVNPATEGVAVAAISSGSKWAIPAAAANVGVKYVVPGTMATLYAYDYGKTLTNDYTGITRESAGKGGERAGYETIPYVLGAYGGAKAYGGLSRVEAGYQSKLQAGETTGRVDYFVKQPTSRVTSRVTADYYRTKELMTTGTTPEMGVTTNTLNMEITGKATPNQARADILKSRVQSSNAGRTPQEPITINLEREIPGYAEARSTQPKVTAGKVGAKEFGIGDYISYKTQKFAAETKGRIALDLAKEPIPEANTVYAPKLTEEPGVILKDSYGRPVLNRKGEVMMKGTGGQEVTNEEFFYRLGQKAYPQTKESPVRMEQFKSYAPETYTVERGYRVTYDAQGKLTTSDVGFNKVTNEEFFNSLNKVYETSPGITSGDSGRVSNLGIGSKWKAWTPREEGKIYVQPENEYPSSVNIYGQGKPFKQQSLEFLIKAGGLTEQLQAKGWQGYGTKLEGGAPKITTGTPPGSPGSRITGTRVVGGRTTPALAKEPSIRSLDLSKETGTPSGVPRKGSDSIGYSVDYRNQPKGSMKPFTKQASQSAVSIMKEEVPILDTKAMTESAIRSEVAFRESRKQSPLFMPQGQSTPTPRSVPQYEMRSGQNLISVVSPETEFMQRSKQDNRFGMTIGSILGSRFGQRSEIRQELGSRSMEDTVSRSRERGLGRGLLPVRAVLPLRGTTPVQDLRTGQRTDRITTVIPRSGTTTAQVPRQDQFRRVITDQSYRQRSILEPPGKQRINIPTPVPFILPGFGGGAPNYSQKARRGRKHYELFGMSVGNVSNIFGAGGGSGNNQRGGKKIYGSFRGTITTGKGKVVKVRPLPKRYQG